MDLRLHDIVELKKPHPCGSKQWEILRTGMDIKLRCQGCGHEIMVLRSRAEKSIRKIVERKSEGQNNEGRKSEGRNNEEKKSETGKEEEP